MFTPPKITTLRFTENGAETQSAIAATTNALIRSSAKPQLRILVAGDSLPSKTVAALISALRKLRGVGGALELRAENEAVRRIILRHGLERVFEFPPVPSVSGTRWHTPRNMFQSVSLAIAKLRRLLGPPPVAYRDQLWMIW